MGERREGWVGGRGGGGGGGGGGGDKGLDFQHLESGGTDQIA